MANQIERLAAVGAVVIALKISRLEIHCCDERRKKKCIGVYMVFLSSSGCNY
jgi:hypothetical protein